MKAFSKLLSPLFLLICVASSQAFATTLQFENTAPPDVFTDMETPYNEAGYVVSTNIPVYAVFVSAAFNNEIGLTAQTSNDILAICGCNSTSIFISRSDNSLFNLNSLDVGTGTFYPSATLKITGVNANAIEYTESFNLPYSQWQTLNFSGNPGFSGLSELIISAESPDSEMSVLSLDNINLTEVPVPAAAWLFGSGLLGVTAARKRKL